MTVFAILGGLLSIIYIDGVDSEVMHRIASPMIGVVISSVILTLVIILLSILWLLKRIKFIKLC